MRNIVKAIGRSMSFALWSLRHRTGQMVPVAIAFLLLLCSVQAIGNLHDVSSTLITQRIARSWRAPYDLFVRPQAAVSQPEHAAGWVSPQSMLAHYGGIGPQQIATIGLLPHIMQVTPYATIGWQETDLIVPLSLAKMGVYRISATWKGQGGRGNTESGATHYVEVSDLAHLTSDPSASSPIVQHLIMKDMATPSVFRLSVPAIQAIIGVSRDQQTRFGQMVLQESISTPAVQLLLHVDKLDGDMSMLSSCVKNTHCWMPEHVDAGMIREQPNGVQLLRYSPTHYTATSQQLRDGQISIDASGSDAQGPLYRTPLAEQRVIPDSLGFASLQATGIEDARHSHVLPFTGPQHLPLIPAAVRFIALEQACAVNGMNCYSGLYLQLSDVDHYSKSSLTVLQATAAAITARTGLHVDILDGSSFRLVTIVSGDGGNTVVASSLWRVLGVAVQIVHGSDALQEMLLVLCSLVCLLALGAAGVLIGVGRKKEALLLREIGWPRYLQWFIFTFDALILSLPAAILSAGWLLVVGRLVWPSSLPPLIGWVLFVMGLLLFVYMLVSVASAPASKKSQALHMKVTAPTVNAIAVISAVFFMLLEYLLISSFNQVLVVTVLGHQIREALEGSQLAIFLLVLIAALLTVGLCTTLLLRGRRKELALLAMVGWEWNVVLLRMMWDSWRPAVLSGVIGAGLALVVMTLGGLPSLLTIVGLLVCGPLLALLLVSVVTIGLAWQETKRVFA